MPSPSSSRLSTLMDPSLRSERPFGHTQSGHAVGWVGFACILVACVYLIKKRFRRKPGGPRRAFQGHSADQFTGHSTPPVWDVHIDAVRHGTSCLRCHTEHRGALVPITIGVLDNPHGEFVFRATGRRSCADCHAVPAATTGRPAVLDNAAVRYLMKQGEGAHRSGAFAHCLRCHTEGTVGLDHDD